MARAAYPWYVPDPYVPAGFDEYTITSLYLDTARLDFYRDRKTLRYDRIKLRVRTYGPANEGPVFAEIKRRFGDTQVKSRARVPKEHWRDMVMPGGPDFEAWALEPSKDRIVRDFVAQCSGRSLRPWVNVRYEREPYVGRESKDLRLTFDRRLRYAPASTLEIEADDRAYRPADFGRSFREADSLVILEIKFTGRFPIWLTELVGRFELARQSFSKYIVSVDLMQDEAELYCPGARRSVVV